MDPGSDLVDASAAVLVFTTLPISADAEAFARALVDERLAACVAVSAEIRSIYRWEGAISVEGERQVIIKTLGGRVQDLCQRLASLHPYTVPEFLVVPAADGSPAYLDWIRGSVSA